MGRLVASSERKAAMGQEQLIAAEAEWPDLIRSVQLEMQRATPAGSPRVLALALRWRALMQQFIGQNEGLRDKISAMYAQEPDLQRHTGVTPELIGYLRSALLAAEPAAQQAGLQP